MFFFAVVGVFAVVDVFLPLLMFSPTTSARNAQDKQRTGYLINGHLMEVIKTHPQFFTATIFQWKHLLEPDKYKLIITDSLSFLVKEKRVWVYAFVIMNNHIHLIWQMRGEHKREAVQRDFLKFTAQAIKFDLTKYHPGVLSAFSVKMKDRAYNFWQRKPLSVDLFSKRVFFQKLSGQDYVNFRNTIPIHQLDFISKEI